VTKSLRHSSRARSAIFAPLGDPGRATRVEQRLAEAIRSGLLADGERLPAEPELAAMLGVATVTAREALISLRAQGLVTTVRGRGGGSFVNRPKHPDDALLGSRLGAMSRVELRDRGTVYRVVLAGCAELAATYADDGDVDMLRDLLVSPDVADVAQWRHADAELCLSIAALTQSARLTREVVRLEADFGVLLRLPLNDAQFRRATARRQAGLVGAIAEHDGELARSHVHDQVDAALDRLVEINAEMR
jgi:DNA-binding FadR family transcriptional regulator